MTGIAAAVVALVLVAFVTVLAAEWLDHRGEGR